MPGHFEVLEEAATQPPRCRLEQEYGAALVLDPARVTVNFTSTLDGIVSFGVGNADSRAVSGGLRGDRLLMAMLRALAGVILIGAGTLRATSRHQWTPQALIPDQAAALAELRSAAGLPDQLAHLVVVSATGELPADADAVRDPAVPLHVVGAREGESGRRVTWLPAATIVEETRRWAGQGPIVCEGGPHLLGTLLQDAVPLELFLTVAPQLAGRAAGSGERRSLVEGVALRPFARPASLRSLRRSGDHLLLRYTIDAAED